MKPTFNRYDICHAYYVFATLFHGGQFTKEYRYLGRLAKLDFNPGGEYDPETLSENAYEIYRNLIIGIGMDPDSEECQLNADH